MLTTLKTYPQQIKNIQYSILITFILYIRSCITGILYPLTNISHLFSLLSTPSNHCSTFYFFELDYFRFHIKVRSCSFCLSHSDLFHSAKCPLGPSIVSQMARLLSFYGSIIFCHVNIPHLLYPFIR